jgi:hypothetical protein
LKDSDPDAPDRGLAQPGSSVRSVEAPEGAGLSAGGASAAGDSGFLVRRCVVAGLVALQQGIALDLGFDEGVDLEIGHLQQLDRLLQLGRHDQRLALAHLQLLPQDMGNSTVGRRRPSRDQPSVKLSPR